MSGVGGREAAVRRVNEALQAYTLSGEGWRRGPGETLQCVLADLLHWCDDTQRDFDAALRRARAQHAAAGGEATGDA
ncbi:MULTISPECIES: hypothetical protein [Streptomyces]|uniref:hypothetical protein n=1 Tax=Streptomyces TaxID=1883 RepID=UPI001962C225|nr:MULTISPECIES: hypothetical protein [Streptomyces]QRX89853.1 hypothetical protein JNO44_02360 [Streptomyces noursei]UJB39868.1 hypothetical protein HRD51_02265 [Streptomyces sp. A1-5]